MIAVTIPSLTTANTFMGNLNPKMSLMISCSPSSKRKDCNISSILNIFLLKALVDAMNRVTEPRKRSRFIAEAVRQKIEQKEKEEMEKLLRKGYRAAAKESLALTKEFEGADLEGWDDF